MEIFVLSIVITNSFFESRINPYMRGSISIFEKGYRSEWAHERFDALCKKYYLRFHIFDIRTARLVQE